MNGECNSGEYIAKSFYCDGGLFQGNAWKPPECADSSDEQIDLCCDYNSPKYDK